MKYIYIVIFFSLCLGGLNTATGQVQENAIPLSAVAKLAPVSYFEEIVPVDTAICKSNSFSEFAQFACPISVDLDPDHSGQWTETSLGKIWRLGIRSADAHSLYINLAFSLAPGAKFFVYTPRYQDLQGAFTSRNNNPSEILSIAPLPGERLILEINLPASQESFGRIKVNKVYHGFKNIFEKLDVNGRKKNTCDEDINCGNGVFWQTEKQSVCKIIVNGMVGTGTLVGNTNGSATPHVLTARHLISTAESAAQALFLFNFETSGCGEELATHTGSLSGATLLATTDHHLDFVLLKPYEPPPPSYHPYYAGWDATHTLPQTAATIHHAFGGRKQIAIEYHPLQSEDIGQGFDAGSTWKVRHWEVGTTEQGSSGAPLFNEQRRVAGTLTGGRSTCGYARDDYFTKFGVAWNKYPDPANQLKFWLDPIQTGQLTVDGYDPYGFNQAYCEATWNFNSRDQLEANKQLSNASSRSLAGFTQFAERYEPAGAIKMNGIYLNVAQAYASSPLASIELKVWQGTELPEKELHSQLIFIKNLLPGEVHFIPFDTVLSHSTPFFVGYESHHLQPSDTFNLYHAKDRGANGVSSMYVYKAGWYRSGDRQALGIATSLGVGISACYGTTKPPSTNTLSLYPNPTQNMLLLDIPQKLPIHEVICHDSSGKPVPVFLNQNEERNKLEFDLPPGVYFLRVITSEKAFLGKFVVM